MTPLAQADAERLTKLCGMLASDFDGERASAALLATRHLRNLGLRWEDLIQRAAGAPPIMARPTVRTDETMLREVLSRRSALTAWENAFADNLLSWQGRFTPKQRSTLARIHARVASGARAA